MSARDISWGLRRPVLKADNLTTFISSSLLEHSGPVQACNGINLPSIQRTQTRIAATQPLTKRENLQITTRVEQKILEADHSRKLMCVQRKSGKINLLPSTVREGKFTSFSHVSS